jgi:hypothetical protein
MRKADKVRLGDKPATPVQSVAFLHRSCNLHCSILLRVGGSAKFVGGIAVIVGAYEGQHFP